MKAPNGFGSVARLSGNRRRPYIIKKTVGWDDRGYPIVEIIGYAATREEGLMILAEYNRDPWDVDRTKITLQQLFNLWKEKKAPKLGASNRAAMLSSYKYCAQLEMKPYKQIRSYQMQETIDTCGKGYSTQSAIKNFWRHLDRLALEMDVISHCYSDLLTSDPVLPSQKKPFTDDEIRKVWEHQHETWVDSVLVFLYSGWRISELLSIKKTDVDLQAGTMKGGTKTKSGKDRIVPIHSRIRPLIDQRMNEQGDYLFSRDGKPCKRTSYRKIWTDIMKNLDMSHTPHECRHTFRTRLDRAGANQKCCDLLMGHASKDTGNRVYNHKTLEELKDAIELIK